MTTIGKFADTLIYVDQQVSSSLSVDLKKRIATAIQLNSLDAVMDPLLAGISTSGAGAYASNGLARRQALRALLLCQKVYLTKISQDSDILDNWVPNWPRVTVDFWRSKSETEIKRAIQMYMPLPNADADALVAAAAANGPTEGLSDGLLSRLHRIAREDASFPVEGICYRAVQSWMLAAGFVSLQWFLKNADTSVNGPVTDANSVASKLLQIFGGGVMIDVSVDLARATIARGDVVYMYRSRQDGTPKHGGQLGHWMVSEGNDFGYGCNNFTTDEALGTAGTYARCSIPNQIKAMRRGRIRPDERDWHFVRVFKPGQLETFPHV